MTVDDGNLMDPNAGIRPEAEWTGVLMMVLDESTDPIFNILEDGTYRYVNPAFSSAFGKAPQEVIGKRIWDIFPLDEAEKRMVIVGKAFATGETSVFEVRVPNSVGDRYFITSMKPIKDVEGRVSSVVCISKDITARKLMEQSLAENQEKFRGLSEAAFEAIFISENGLCLEQNRRAEEIFGYSSQEALGRPGTEWIAPEDRDRVMKHMLAGYELPYEATGLRKDGSTFPALIRGKIMSYQGRTVRVTSMSDITDRKRVEKALEAESSALAAVIDNNPMSIQILDLDGKTLKTNAAHTRLFGSQPPPDYTVFTDPLMERLGLSPLWDRVRAGEVVFFPEFQYNAHELFPDLPDVPVLIRMVGFSVFGKDGRPERHVLMHEDVTQQRSAEQALRESNELLTLFVHHSPIYTYIKEVTATESRVLQASENFERMIGVKGSDMVGKTMAEVFPADLADKILLDDLAVVSGGEELEVEEELNGRTYTTLKYPIVQGDKTLLAGFTIDITERKQAEEAQLKLQAQLQQAQKMESLGILAGGVAHDMNNVLGAILGMAELGIEGQPEDSRVFHSFDTIIHAAERGGKMVKTLLSFARQNPAEERELDMNLILREEVHLLERTTLSKVRLYLDLAPDLRLMLGDAGALTNAFMNLCVNAVDAMPDNGTLTLRTRNVDRDWIEVQVEDTGTGMPKEVLEKALDPFYTTKGVGKGTGLGLSMVYSTVKAHRGQMELQSEPGRGTRVRMRFPACEVIDQISVPMAEPQFESSLRKLSVLLVDDDELIQRTLQSILKAMGHSVTAVFDGENALAKLEAGLQPDLVILDMNMPGLGGAGTLPRLRALRPTVPIVLATGRADQAALDLVEAHPHVFLLSKPFGIKELQLHLDKVGRGH